MFWGPMGPKKQIWQNGLCVYFFKISLRTFRTTQYKKKSYPNKFEGFLNKAVKLSWRREGVVICYNTDKSYLVCMNMHPAYAISIITSVASTSRSCLSIFPVPGLALIYFEYITYNLINTPLWRREIKIKEKKMIYLVSVR